MAQKTYDVVGIGNAIVDIIARCDEGFLTKHDLVKGSMRLIDAEEANRLYGAMGPAVERSGGSVANAIAGLASFGAESGFIGRVAADQFGGIFRHDIRSLGVAYDTPPATDGEPTARCLILVDAGRRAHHEHLSRRQRRFCTRRSRPRHDLRRQDRLPRRLSVRPRRGEGRLQRGRKRRQGGRGQGGAQPVRCLLRRPSPRRFQGSDAATMPISSSPTRRRSPTLYRVNSFDEAAKPQAPIARWPSSPAPRRDR